MTVRLTPLEPWIAATIGADGPGLDRAQLQRHQLARLRSTVQLARERSPFYRDRLRDLPIGPDTLQDVARYPFTTAADLAAHGPRMVCVSQDDVTRVVTTQEPPEQLAVLDTSGTTGAPKRLWFTGSDQELTIDFFRVGMSTFTDPGDRVLVLLPCERPGGVGDLLATALERLGARPIRHGVVQDVDATLALLREHRPDVAVGIPAQVLALARRDPGLRLKAVLLSTDHVPLSLTRAVEQAWHCRVFNHYGMTETGLGGGVECEARRGYHLREADLYVEIVEPDGALPVPDGEPGEVVVTTLTRTGMPLIRYRTGDLSRFIPGPCPCGSTLRTLERITRRAAGVVRTSTGAGLALAELDEVLFGLPGVLDFDASLRRGATGDTLELDVRVAAGPGAPQLAPDTVAAAVNVIPALDPGSPSGAVGVRIIVRPATAVAAPAKRRMKVVERDA
jgi:phenylacetate-coenzyme A ligase PaaK-like adenylate-forming protein